jgi:hypothetical protein
LPAVCLPRCLSGAQASLVEVDNLFKEEIALGEQGKWAEAVVSFNAVVSANHRTASCRLGFAEHNKAGEHCEASFEPYTRCLELNPTNVAAHINLSGVLRDVRKDVDGTERLLRSALELDPQSPNTRGHISFLLEQRGDLDGAIVEMEGFFFVLCIVVLVAGLLCCRRYLSRGFPVGNPQLDRPTQPTATMVSLRSQAQADEFAQEDVEQEELARLKERAETEKVTRLAEAKARAQAGGLEAEKAASKENDAAELAWLKSRSEPESVARSVKAKVRALKSDNGDPKLLAFLTSIGQEHALKNFVKEDVTFATLELCDSESKLDDFLCSLEGLKMGARKKIMNAFCSVSAAAKSFAIDQHNIQVEEGATHLERLELKLSEHRAEIARLRGAMERGGVPREFECPIRCARVTCHNFMHCDELS